MWKANANIQTYCKGCRDGNHSLYQKTDCVDCEYEEPYLYAVNRHFNSIYCLAPHDGFGGFMIDGFRALMLDHDVGKSERRWWYRKAMAVEDIRQKAGKIDKEERQIKAKGKARQGKGN